MQPYIVPLNSNQRDINAPNVSTNNFTIHLKSPIINATSVELRSALIANTSYIVNTYNNVLSVTSAGTNYNVAIPLGNYTAQQLAAELQSQLATAIVAITWTVT
jgi:hypothetical protein